MTFISTDEIKASSVTRARFQALLAKDPDGAHQALVDLGFHKMTDTIRPGSLAIKSKMPVIQAMAFDLAMDQAGQLFTACLDAGMPEIFDGVLAEMRKPGGSLEGALRIVDGERAVVDQINAGLSKRRSTTPSPVPTKPMFPYL